MTVEDSGYGPDTRAHRDKVLNDAGLDPAGNEREVNITHYLAPQMDEQGYVLLRPEVMAMLSDIKHLLIWQVRAAVQAVDGNTHQVPPLPVVLDPAPRYDQVYDQAMSALDPAP